MGAISPGPVYQTFQALAQSKTVHLLRSESTSEKQAKINAVPRWAEAGVVVTFQFEDGVHNETDTLYLNGFTFPIVVQGNPTDADALSTAQNVTVSNDANKSVFEFNDCKNVTFQKLKMTLADVAGAFCVRLVNVGKVQMKYCYGLGSGIVNETALIRADECGGFASSNYVSNLRYGIYMFRNIYQSINNDDTGTPPAYGLSCNGGTLTKSGTQPAGSTLNELSASGGAIR